MVVGLIEDGVDTVTDAGETVADTAVGVGEEALDVPADAVNATTGTGENLGWFGTIDRALDPRSISEEEAAEPTAETTGFSGFVSGALGSTTQAASDAGALTTQPLLAGLGFGTGGQHQSQQGQQQPEQSDQGQRGVPPDLLLIGLVLLGVVVAYSLGGGA